MPVLGPCPAGRRCSHWPRGEKALARGVVSRPVEAQGIAFDGERPLVGLHPRQRRGQLAALAGAVRSVFDDRALAAQTPHVVADLADLQVLANDRARIAAHLARIGDHFRLGGEPHTQALTDNRCLRRKRLAGQEHPKRQEQSISAMVQFASPVASSLY